VPGLSGAAFRQAARLATAPQSAATRGSQLTRAGGETPDLAPFSPNPLHGYWGTDNDKTNYGAEATQSLNSFVLPAGSKDLLYAPTLDPSGIDCIEMTTVYSGGHDEIGAFNWCEAQPNWGKLTADNTASFRADYTVTLSGQRFYTVLDEQTNAKTNRWIAYLFNYHTGKWDTFFSSASTKKLSNTGGRWDMFEDYTYDNKATGEGSYCSYTYGANWESQSLEYEVSRGTWAFATPANSHPNIAYPRGSDLGCDTNHFAYPNPNSDLTLGNSTHGASELAGTGSGTCLDAKAYANGAKAQVEPCHGSGPEKWTYNKAGELTVDGGKYCLDARSPATANGTPVQVWACRGTTNQEWSFSVGNTVPVIGSGKCLDLPKTASGTQLVLESCTAAGNQKWRWK